MPTNDPANPHVNDHERAVRRVLGYPAEGPIKTVANFPNMPVAKPRRCVRVAHASIVESEASDDAQKFHVLVGKAWMHMLHVCGRSVGGYDTMVRCVCVEAALRDYVLRELALGLELVGQGGHADALALYRRLAHDPATLLTAFEQPLYLAARAHLPLAAVVEASGLRIDVENPDPALPARLVAHAESCTIPYPVKIVCTRPASEVVGDVS